MISPISKLSGKIEDCRDTALRTVLSEMDLVRWKFCLRDSFLAFYMDFVESCLYIVEGSEKS